VGLNARGELVRLLPGGAEVPIDAAGTPTGASE